MKAAFHSPFPVSDCSLAIPNNKETEKISNICSDYIIICKTPRNTLTTLVKQYSSSGSLEHATDWVCEQGRILGTWVKQGLQSIKHFLGHGWPTEQERVQGSWHVCFVCSRSSTWQILVQVWEQGIGVEHFKKHPPSGGKWDGWLAWNDDQIIMVNRQFNN